MKKAVAYDIETVKSLSHRIALTVFAINVLYVNSYLGNPMSKSILDLTVSLVDRGSLNINPLAFNSMDIAKRGQDYYSGMPPGLSVVCVPYYLVAKTWLWLIVRPEWEDVPYGGDIDDAGRPAPVQRLKKDARIILLNVFICWFGCCVAAGVMAALFHRAMTLLYPDLDERRRLITTWLFSFGTLWFVYSPAIYHRIFSTFLCFAAFLSVLSFNAAIGTPQSAPRNRQSAFRGFLFGAALGLAIATSYEMAIVVAAVLAYTLATRRLDWPWLGTAAGLAVPLALLAAYHTACFGAPWITPYAMRIQGSVVPPLFRQSTGAGAWSLARWYALLFGFDYGFFFYSPLLLLSLPAVTRLLRNGRVRPVAAMAFAIFIALLVFHWASGYRGLPGEFGFRMMKPAIPFLMLLVPMSYRWSWRYVVPVLTALSAVILAKGVMFGVHAGRPFWSDYLARLQRQGFANYTLDRLREYAWPEFSPWAISAIHLAVLAGVLFLLRRYVWRDEAVKSGL
ncbi:MAG: hypothetical protein N3D11_13805 [Candidatus Sumerlaeia bacterium]|nr:hypothetical protein [Candidatus Sumerlaeia bacterium]